MTIGRKCEWSKHRQALIKKAFEYAFPKAQVLIRLWDYGSQVAVGLFYDKPEGRTCDMRDKRNVEVHIELPYKKRKVLEIIEFLKADCGNR